jgi:dipeptidyl aminopeptidase/acylaminoacyl peptidase
MKMKIAGIIVVFLITIVFFLGWRTPSLSDNHGKMDTHLYLSDSINQPLIVGFGGASGGNDWERNYLKGKRDSILAQGFAVLAIGYYNTENSPGSLDRISLNAIADTILSIARRTPQIDTSRIFLMGGSKGGELVLNLASRYSCFKGVIALSTPHVSFPALTISANTSSWMYNNQEVTYVPAPFKTIWPALKRDLFQAHSIMLENTEAVALAEIEVEKINGPILIISADEDEIIPAAKMSEQLVERLKRKNFNHPYQHVVVNGSHIEPLNHFDKVYAFLDRLK